MERLMASNWKSNVPNVGIVEVEIRGVEVSVIIAGQPYEMGLVEQHPNLTPQSSYRITDPHLWDEENQRINLNDSAS